MQLNKERRTKVLFLLSNTGSGHKSSADAVISALNEISDNKLHPVIMDLFSETNKSLDKIIKEFYTKSIRNTSLEHGILFHITNNKYIWDSIKPVYNVIYENLKRKIINLKPDMIISVHPLVNYITKKVLTELNLKVPFIIIITDPVTLHQGWVEEKADFIIVATKSAEKKLIKEGIEKRKIKIFGLPIRTEFYQHNLNLGNIRKRFELKNKFTVLFTGGGEGAGKIYLIIRLLLTKKLDMQIIAVCGRNDELKEKLSKLPLKVIGYTDKMHELMAISDLVVSKAGPATIEEAITKGLPIIITNYIKGQEKGNIAYAKERTRAYYEPNIRKGVEIIKDEYLHRRKRLDNIHKSSAPVYKIALFIKEILENM